MKRIIPRNERERLKALRRYQILDTLPEPVYDDITLLAATVCNTPIAAISFIDRYRQWFKSSIGLELRETPREVSFCARAIMNDRLPLLVEDATKDPRFADNPLVTGTAGFRSYAGIPIIARGRHPLGALCVIDRVPRVMSPNQIRALRVLAEQVATHLERRSDRLSQDSGQAPLEPATSTETAMSRLCLLLDGLRLGIFSATGFLGRITERNQAFGDLIEEAAEGARGEVRLRDLFVDPAEYDRLIERLLESNRIMVQEVRLKSLQGHPFLALLTASAERVSHIVCVSGAIQDITSARRMELERDRFLNLSLDMMCITGMDGHIKLVNRSFEQAFGHSRQDLEMRPFFDLVHPDDVARTISKAMTLADGDHVAIFENRFLCRNGEYKQISWAATAIPEEGLVYAIGHDITERLRAEETERALVANNVEFQLAREIQRRQLPERPPSLEGFDIAGVVRQIDEIGGDFYDYIPGPDGTLFLVVGDVSGHGVAPSVVMAQVRMGLWSIIPQGAPIGEIIDRVNSLLHASIPERLFVTLELLALNPRTGIIRHANCAHPSGFLLAPSGDIVTRLESGGLPLGCFDSCRLSGVDELRFPPGGTLVLMTDGMLEASSPSGEQFGEERVLDVVRVNHHKSSGEIVERLHAAIDAFSRDTPARDDMTALVARHVGGAF